MLLTNDELQLVREAVETQAGIDRDLVQRCSRLIHIKAFDEAVQQAFVLLEERMRRLLKRDISTGMQMVQYAFSPEGPFTKLLADNKAEREGFEHLLSAAFKLYRNPAAHTIVGYSGADARAIIGLVDLILKRLDYLATIPQTGSLPANIENTLLLVEKNAGSKVASQIRVFLGKCINEGLDVKVSATKWIPFRRQALIKRDGWPAPRPYMLTVFYFYNSDKDQGLWFPVKQYYKNVINLNTDDIIKRLRILGFQPIGATQDPYLSVNVAKDKDYYNRLFAEVQQIVKDFDATLLLRSEL